MGSGIAQKMATEGFPVILVDLDDDKVAARPGASSRRRSHDGVERKIFTRGRAKAIRARIRGTTDWSTISRDADLVVEAVFEDLDVKRNVFARLERVCRADAILATNTSSFSVDRLAAGTTHPGAGDRAALLLSSGEEPPRRGRSPARPRSPAVLARGLDRCRSGWARRRSARADVVAASSSIASSCPWLDRGGAPARRGDRRHPDDRSRGEEGVRHRHGAVRADERHRHSDRGARRRHARRGVRAAATARRLAADAGRSQGSRGISTGDADPTKFDAVGDRLARRRRSSSPSALVDEGVGTIEDTDIGARVGLRWRRGPFELMNRYGLSARRRRSSRHVRRRAGTCRCRRSLAARRAAGRAVRASRSCGPRRPRRHRHADHQSSRRDERAERSGHGAAARRVPGGGRRSGGDGASSSPAAARRSSPAPTSASSSRTSRRRTSRTIVEFTKAGQALLLEHRDAAASRSSRACMGWRWAAASSWPSPATYIVATPKATLRVSRDRHRHLSGPRRHAADDRARRSRSREVARPHRRDGHGRAGVGDRPHRSCRAVRGSRRGHP